MTVGYSGTPLPKKLGIKPGMSMAVLNAPSNLDAILGELPDRVATGRRLSGHQDLVLIFVIRQVDFAVPHPCLDRCDRAGWHDLGRGAEACEQDRDGHD